MNPKQVILKYPTNMLVNEDVMTKLPHAQPADLTYEGNTKHTMIHNSTIPELPTCKGVLEDLKPWTHVEASVNIPAWG